jgi:hypothetical protein
VMTIAHPFPCGMTSYDICAIGDLALSPKAKYQECKAVADRPETMVSAIRM